MKHLPYISVVVCSYNGEKTLSDCLSALKKQRWDGKLEIIVVDDGSTDKTYEIARSFPGIRVIKNTRNLGLAAARNVGIDVARGTIIAFTDDDCCARPTWIKQLYVGYKDESVIGVGGALISKDRSKFMLRYLQLHNPLQVLEYSLFSTRNLGRRFVIYLKELVGMNHRVNHRRAIYSFVGGNMSFRKDALIQMGLFDPAFTFGGEDQELCRRINIQHPKSLYFAPRAIIVHQFDARLQDTLRRSKSYGIGNARLARKHNDLSHTLYPFPTFIILSFLLGLINPWLFLTPLVLTQIVYPRGLLEVLHRRSLEPLLYSYIQCLQEIFNNIGYVIGWWKFRNTFRNPADVTNIHELRRSRLREGMLIIMLLFAAVAASDFIKNTAVLHVPDALVIILGSGYILLRCFGGYRKSRLPVMLRLGLMVALGVFWLMLFGLLIDILLPLFGVKHPLTSNWTFLLFPLVTGLLVPWYLKPKAPSLRPKTSIGWDTWLLGGLLVLILSISFIGARLLNNGYSNIPAMVAFGLGFLAIIFAVARQKHLAKTMLPLTLFVISLAGIWSYSLRSNYVFGWDIQQEYQVFRTTLTAGKWALGAKHTPYSAMLSLTIFPVMTSKLAGISGLTIFKFLSPVIFSFVPVVLYYIYRQFTRRWISFVASLIIVAQFYYMQQFSGEVRQQIAFLFFACILYLLLQNRLSRHTKNTILFVFLLGLVVAHYSTTYLAIIFFSGTYLITKLMLLLRAPRPVRKSTAKSTYVKGWVVLTLCVGAALWYGPATQSYGNIQSFNQTTSYSHVLTTIINDITSHSVKSQPAPATTQLYLKDIGAYYRTNHTYFTYYQGATNKSVTPLTQPTIRTKSPLLTSLYNVVDLAFSYGWWLLGSIGVGVVLLWSYRQREFKKMELGVIGLIGIFAFVVIHIVPSLQLVYNPSRLNEQVLMVVALPAVLVTVWLLQRVLRNGTRYLVACTIGLAFLMASGVTTQFVGGKPSANINNDGTDYSSLYVQQTDIAAANWLGTNYKATSSVFTDDYGSLRLQAESNIDHGEQVELTPETIAQGSYVYADATNVKDGIATGTIGGSIYSYSFPTSYLQQHKDLVYTNGDAEVYK